MSGQQSKESAVAIGKLDERVKGLQQQVDRRFLDMGRDMDALKTDMRDDMNELKDDMKWVRRTMIGMIISLLIVAASVLLTTLGG